MMVDSKSVPEYVERPFTEEEKKNQDEFHDLLNKIKNLAAFRQKEQQRYLKEGLYFDHIESEIEAKKKLEGLMLESNKAEYDFNLSAAYIKKGTKKINKELEDMKKHGDTN